ncbi:MAG TPA: metal-sulfur cluster assembly factor [Candidatus Paceibacterota bacterium]|nr:metal-sulfur cluster assembly factor [Candidatus Paceibacterota bacterium]HQB57026.1 metal-sulfur cluster assembly factor [Candidatus Paceibacterota bacterium]
MLEEKEIKQKILEILKGIPDPELGIDIVSLGLIKKIEIGEYLEEFKVYDFIKITMTLTSVMCPFADKIIEDVELKANSLNFGEIQVDLDFSEPWEPSEELRMQLGI